MFNTFDLIYFSPTFTTQRILREIASTHSEKLQREIDLTPQGKTATYDYSPQEALLIGFPVYAGRVPQPFTERIKGLRGANSPAIIVAVYGNRAYDDALMEMKMVLEQQGFYIAGAAAFIAQHSIVPSIASGRPDAEDLAYARRFGQEVFEKLEKAAPFSPQMPGLPIKGQVPLRPYYRMPVHPKANRHCQKCGLCAQQCPMGAIPLQNPKETDPQLCITCMRCVHICPHHARNINFLVRLLTRRKLSKLCKERKRPEWVL